MRIVVDCQENSGHSFWSLPWRRSWLNFETQPVERCATPSALGHRSTLGIAKLLTICCCTGACHPTELHKPSVEDMPTEIRTCEDARLARLWGHRRPRHHEQVLGVRASYSVAGLTCTILILG